VGGVEGGLLEGGGDGVGHGGPLYCVYDRG
jgi:hypothetical protein